MIKLPGRSRRSSIRALAGAVVALALVAAGCSGGGTAAGPQASGQGGVLNIGSPYAPNSLDPAKINLAMVWYADLAYDPLIYLAPSGKLQPRLALSWGYVGNSNEVFELHLRPNVRFSDGSPLTADVVKANILYMRGSTGGVAAYFSGVQSVDVPSPLTVRITLSAPDPSLPEIFTQQYQAGNMASGPALQQPQKLATQTLGAGPYVLDSAASVANDHYTYTPNPHYWNKSAIHYQQVVVKVFPNANTALAALKTGQVDVIQGMYSTADAASAAGLRVLSVPHVFQGLALADRAGSIVPALGNLQVRQALNYAVDRQQLSSALLSKYGKPTEQIALPGQDGYSSHTFYSYDPAKARQLLAQAGYPHGFTLPVVDDTNIDVLTQAIADQLKAVGVTVQITDDSDPNQYLRDLTSGKFAAYAIGYGSQPIYIEGPQLFLPSAAVFNPHKTSDPQIESLYSQAAAANPAERAQLDQQIVTRLDQQAWFVPVTFVPVFYFSRPTVGGINASTAAPSADPADWLPA